MYASESKDTLLVALQTSSVFQLKAWRGQELTGVKKEMTFEFLQFSVNGLFREWLHVFKVKEE